MHISGENPDRRFFHYGHYVRIAGFLAALVSGSGCGDDSQTGESGPATDCTPGYEGCACVAPPAADTGTEQGRCLDGLRCLSELCVLDDGWSSSTSQAQVTDSGSGGQAGDASTGEHPGTAGVDETSSASTTSGAAETSDTTGSSATASSTTDEGTTTTGDDESTTEASTTETGSDESTTETGSDDSTTETTDSDTSGDTSDSGDIESTTEDSSDSANDDSELIPGADDELTVWYRRLTSRSDGSPSGVTADGDNHVYMMARLPGNDGLTLASYDELGTARWSEPVFGAFAIGDVAVDNQGYLAVGYRLSPEGMGIQLRRADDGGHVWTRTEDLGSSSNTSEIAFAHDGTILAAGMYSERNRGFLLWRRNYDRDGYLIWKNPARRQSEWHRARGLAALPMGGFVLASFFTVDDLPADARINAYNAAGQSTWSINLVSQGSDNVTQGSDITSDITTDADGNVFFTHISRIDEDDGRSVWLHVASHGLDGKLRWEFNQRLEGADGCFVAATIARSTGDTLVFGSTSTRDADGSTHGHPWVRRFGPGGEEGWHADLDPSFSLSRVAAGSGTTLYGLGEHTSPDGRVILVRFDIPFGNRLTD